MKETLLACCKYVMFAAALIPFLVIAYVMFPVLSWSWRIGAFLPFVVLLLWGSLHLLKALLLRLKARQQPPVRTLTEGGGTRPEQTPGGIRALQQDWKQGIDTLQGSHLRQEGDPLYVLPWFLIMGEGQSGKSALVRNARLRSPFAANDGLVGGTQNCDWYFYDQGVVIDTAGRYAVASEPRGDREEWHRLLWLLRKYRKKEPLNGLLLTLPADKLMKGDLQEIEEYGRQLRLRIDEMTRLLGVRFPVYLLITKCDLIGGMASFCGSIPEPGLDQPMGLLNEDPTGDLQGYLARFWQCLDLRLRELRLLLLHRQPSASAGAEFLLFPDRLRALKPALQSFMQNAFAQNHYQETPLLRGIYLSSAGSELRETGAKGDAAASQGGSGGMFLRDFFEKVLPADRGLWGPTEAAVSWRRTTGKVAVAAGMFAGISLCCLLSASFIKNLAVVRYAVALDGTESGSGGKEDPSLAALEAMRSRVLVLERKNRDWWVPRLGLNRSLEVEQMLKSRYCRDFHDRFLVFSDRDLAATVAALSPATPDAFFGGCVAHISRRCNLLQARLEREPFHALSASALPVYPSLPSHSSDDAGVAFANLYLSYLAWNVDGKQLGEELQALQSLLKKALDVKGTDLDWLIGFVNWQHGSAAMSLQQFWHGSRPLPSEAAILPAFTRKGKQAIAALLDEVSSASSEPGAFRARRAAFEARYRAASLSAWQQFALQLSAGEQRLVGSREWHAAAERMAGEEGPYFAFIRSALSELAPFPEGEDLPVWISQLRRFQSLKSAGREDFASAGDGKERMADRLGSLVGGSRTDFAHSGAGVTREYLNAIARIAPVAKSRVLAHQMALQAFKESAEASKSPLFQAMGAAQRLNALLIQGGDDATFARLVSGPITFYGTFIRMETACALQAQWEEKVLKEVQGASDPQTLQYLLGRDGPVWKYVGDVADPFIGWNPGRGYYAKSALGGAIPFRPEFYSFLAKGARVKVASAQAPKANYQVTLTGLPTDANAEATVKPQGTRLEMHCATGPQVMTNMNYPVSKPFLWSPDACGDVLLQIEIGDTVLTRRYQGADGFPAFLRDFPGGRHTFYPAQFPRQREALERMGVRFIRVNYRMLGATEIASGKDGQLPGRVPAKIADCWD